ncbi:RsmB/NOP family class I SAM-dependent RNA methyltransferase [Lignipirellula cremea]|uniref:Ribosomal RNA small subunit methyltransferase F n=1 Tax=Lignipirellula cremea TaxID=2528010 RepID=A0A518DZN6_9BACT|nr:RsmB/NOP family class I SAM-dependent RNA methyltransferase [Lignipirellula cremea]QDU97299.1 Ribosomal RNA small subunit methyltransferase F [Lignipirellula cremea]
MNKSARDFEDRKRREFLARVGKILDIDRHRAEEAFHIELQSSLRINRLTEISVPEIFARLEQAEVELEPIPWRDDAWHLLSDKKAVSQSAFFEQGYTYLQNASSLAPVAILDPQPGESILDVCAAPGGKSSDIASRTGNQCRLWLNDSIQPRIDKLREVVAQFHVKAEQITDYPGQYLTKHLDETFDRILLDAQCSGEGMIDLNHPRALRFWSLARIRKFARLQEKMLSEAFKLLRPGGVLVYSTCTLAPEENEAPVDRLLRICPTATLEPIGIDLPGGRPGVTGWENRRFDKRLEHAVRITPSIFYETFFVCRIRKEE